MVYGRHLVRGTITGLATRGKSARLANRPRSVQMTVPFDQLEGLIWFDGKLVPGPQANIHVLTHGLHYASAVFEGERAYAGEIFKCTEHSERLKRSANVLDFEI